MWDSEVFLFSFEARSVVPVIHLLPLSASFTFDCRYAVMPDTPLRYLENNGF